MPKYSMKFMILKDISALSKDRAALSRKDVFQAFFLWFGVLLRALTQKSTTAFAAVFFAHEKGPRTIRSDAPGDCRSARGSVAERPA